MRFWYFVIASYGLQCHSLSMISVLRITTVRNICHHSIWMVSINMYNLQTSEDVVMIADGIKRSV